LNFSSHAGDPINGSPNFNVDLGHLFDFTEPTLSVEVSGTLDPIGFDSNRLLSTPVIVARAAMVGKQRGGVRPSASNDKMGVISPVLVQLVDRKKSWNITGKS